MFDTHLIQLLFNLGQLFNSELFQSNLLLRGHDKVTVVGRVQSGCAREAFKVNSIYKVANDAGEC